MTPLSVEIDMLPIFLPRPVTVGLSYGREYFKNYQTFEYAERHKFVIFTRIVNVT